MPDGIRITEELPDGAPAGTDAKYQFVARAAWFYMRTAWALGTVAMRFVWVMGTWPLRWVAGYIKATILRLYVLHFVQSDSKAKCPACGIRAEHDVRWSDVASALIHVCKRCFAVWSEQPLVDAAQWRTQLVASSDDTSPDGTRTTTVQHAQREPQLSYTPTGKDRPIVLRLREPDAVVHQKGGNA